SSVPATSRSDHPTIPLPACAPASRRRTSPRRQLSPDTVKPSACQRSGSSPSVSSSIVGGGIVAAALLLGVPEHRVRDVWLLQARDLLLAERELLGGERVMQVLWLGGADDRR